MFFSQVQKALRCETAHRFIRHLSVKAFTQEEASTCVKLYRKYGLKFLKAAETFYKKFPCRGTGTESPGKAARGRGDGVPGKSRAGVRGRSPREKPRRGTGTESPEKPAQGRGGGAHEKPARGRSPREKARRFLLKNGDFSCARYKTMIY